MASDKLGSLPFGLKKTSYSPTSDHLKCSGAHPPYNRLNALMGRPPAFILSLRATYTQRSGLEGRGPRSVSRRTGAW